MPVDDHASAVLDPKRLAVLHRLALLDTRGEAAFDRLTRLAVRVLKVSTALVSLIDAERQVFISCAGPAAPLPSQYELPLNYSFCRHSVESGQPLIIADTHQDPLVQDNPAINAINIRAYAGIPLITSDGYVLGSLCVACTAPRAWTAEDIATLQDLTALVMTQIELRALLRAKQRHEGTLEQRIEQGNTELAESNEALQAEIVEHHEAQERLQRQNRYLGAINEVTLASIRWASVTELLDIIIHRGETLVQGANGSLWLVDPDGTRITLRAATGDIQPYIGSSVRLGEGMAGKVWQTGQPLMVKDYATWSERGDSASSVKDIHAALQLPLRSGRQVLGVFGVAHSEPEQNFRPNEIFLFERFTEIVAVVIANAQTNAALQEELAERKRAEELLEQERNLLRTLIDSLPDFVFVRDIQGRFIISNDAFARAVTAVSDASIIAKLPFEVLPTQLQLAEQFQTDDLLILHSGQPLMNVERLMLDAAGASHWMSTTKVPFKDKQGQTIGIVGITRDITERKQTEELLAQERNLLRTLIDNLPDYIFVKDTQGRFIISNDAHTQAARAAHDTNIVGKLPVDLFPIELAEQFQADDMALLESGQALINGERLTIDAAGNPRWVLTTKVPLRDKEGQTIGLVGISHDITERKQAEDILRASAIENAQLYELLLKYADELEARVTERTKEFQQAKDNVEAILNTSSDAILVTRSAGDSEWVIEQANPAFSQLFGYASHAALDFSLLSLADIASVEKLRETLLYVTQTSASQRLEIVACRRDGSTFDADLALAPIQRPDQTIAGEIVGIVCNIRDMTQRKLMEYELRQTLEKERELSELKSRFVSLVSHEFRTPLAIILAASNVLKSYSERMTSAEKQDRFAKIERGIAQMTSLLEDVLTLSQGEAGQLSFRPVPIDLEVVCQDVLSEVQTIWGQEHLFAFTRHGETIQVTMDPKLLQHILVNLLLNAIKYSPVGSTVYFDLVCEPQVATFRIRDEGMGIPLGDQEKLFDAFHRAENVNDIGGTGLGLTIVKQAVVRHGGSIRFESTLNIGTLFTVTIPNIATEPSKYDQNSDN